MSQKLSINELRNNKPTRNNMLYNN